MIYQIFLILLGILFMIYAFRNRPTWGEYQTGEEGPYGIGLIGLLLVGVGVMLLVINSV